MANKYLTRYAEQEARYFQANPLDDYYHHCLVIPAYRETRAVLDRLSHVNTNQEKLVTILVLNQPDSDTSATANDELREAVRRFGCVENYAQTNARLVSLSALHHLLLLERPQALPAAEGVGLARKLGCDIAAGLMQSGCLAAGWIHCTDADSTLPKNYFSSAKQHAGEAAALLRPFHHQPMDDSKLGLAMALYELRLHYYVLGLQSAGSPYAFHSLGSCLSIDNKRYEQVRGVPRRAAGEDFYLLNKAAKLAPLVTDTQAEIEIETRLSNRVPFGTGSAVDKLTSDGGIPLQSPLFYHPRSFALLAEVIALVPALFAHTAPLHRLAAALAYHAPAFNVLEAMGIDKCLQHCARQSDSPAAYARHFHQWFDGFRTLKFMHGLREAGWQDLNFAQSQQQTHSIWPQTLAAPVTPLAMLDSCRAALGWRTLNRL